jgi:hypothetical protein
MLKDIRLACKTCRSSPAHLLRTADPLTRVAASPTSIACSSHLACTPPASIRKKAALKRSSMQRYPSPATSAAKLLAARLHFLQAPAQSADGEGAGRAAESASAAAAALTPLAKQALQVHSGMQTVSFFEWLELLLRRVLKPSHPSKKPRCVALRVASNASLKSVCNRRVADAAGLAPGCAPPCATASSQRTPLYNRHAVCVVTLRCQVRFAAPANERPAGESPPPPSPASHTPPLACSPAATSSWWSSGRRPCRQLCR